MPACRGGTVSQSFSLESSAIPTTIAVNDKSAASDMRGTKDMRNRDLLLANQPHAARYYHE